MTQNDLLTERLKLFKGMVRGEKVSRVPTASNVFTWKILDSETKATIMQANKDWALMEKIIREFHERYRFDYYEDLGTRNMFSVSDALGGAGYVVNDETGTINAPDVCLMTEHEYDEIINNPAMFGWTKIMPRKFGDFTYEQFRTAIREFIKSNDYKVKIADIFAEEYGVPYRCTSPALSPIEDLFSWGLRGIKYLSGDMRRYPEKVEAYVEANEPKVLDAVKNAFENKREESAFDIVSVFLAHSIMNEKQFERFYFRTIKKIIDMAIFNSGMFSVFCEASFLHIKDFFADIPKGYVCIGIEQDDIFEVRKQCHNICLNGGMTADLLGKDDASQCVDHAKKLIDEIACEGFIMGQNKMISFRNDCKRENLLAVQDFVLNYKI